MSLIKLDKVTKVYYSEGSVVNAVSRVSAEFNIGEFVAITGESGSGKTTLANVIAGLDTYEEGEMYVNGEETSAYDENDFEEYRKNYIGFIFQNFALIDSYTVLQNVEVVLSIQGIPHKEVRKKAIEYLRKVGLEKHIKHRGTQLSGGQKQRLSIARALAKEAKIIIADEPTGNLDSESGAQVLKLLAELSNECLVIVVTHNYPEVEQYVTRKIRMFDGQIAEDKKIKKVADSTCVIEDKKVSDTVKAIKFALIDFKAQPFRLVLMMFVTLFTCLVMSLLFGNYIKPIDDLSSVFWGGPYSNPYLTRIIVQNETGLTESDYTVLSNISNVKNVIRYDEVIDMGMNYYDKDGTGDSIYHDHCYIRSINDIDSSQIISGRMPINDNEVVLTKKYDGRTPEKRKYFFSTYFSLEKEYEVVGVVEREEQNGYVFLSDSNIANISASARAQSYQIYGSSIFKDLDDNITERSIYVGFNFSETIPAGKIEYYKSYYDEELKGTFTEISFDYFTKNLTYTAEDITMKESDGYSAKVVMNYQDFASLIVGNEIKPQYSITVDHYRNVDKVLDSLKDLGYYAVSPYNASQMDLQIFSFISNFFYQIFLIFAFFVVYILSYLVFKVILNTKQKDYNILRAIGLNNSSVRIMTYFVLILHFAIAQVIVFALGLWGKILLDDNVRNIFTNMIGGAFVYYQWYHYFIASALSIVLALLIGNRYNGRILNKSIITAMKGEEN